MTVCTVPGEVKARDANLEDLYLATIEGGLNVQRSNFSATVLDGITITELTEAEASTVSVPFRLPSRLA